MLGRGTLEQERIEIEVAQGIELNQIETVVRDALRQAAAEGVVPEKLADETEIERGQQGIADPFTAAIIVFGPVAAAIARDVWVRYIRPRLDARYGNGAVRERPRRT
jgi:hypothetical protein